MLVPYRDGDNLNALNYISMEFRQFLNRQFPTPFVCTQITDFSSDCIPCPRHVPLGWPNSLALEHWMRILEARHDRVELSGIIHGWLKSWFISPIGVLREKIPSLNIIGLIRIFSILIPFRNRHQREIKRRESLLPVDNRKERNSRRPTSINRLSNDGTQKQRIIAATVINAFVLHAIQVIPEPLDLSIFPPHIVPLEFGRAVAPLPNGEESMNGNSLPLERFDALDHAFPRGDRCDPSSWDATPTAPMGLPAPYPRRAYWPATASLTCSAPSTCSETPEMKRASSECRKRAA